MAEMLVDSTKLDACLDAEADAIRAKTGDSNDLTFDFANNKGFADAIAAIPTGGGGWELIAEATASEDVATILLDIPTGKRNMACYIVRLTGKTNKSEWVYPGLNTTSVSTGGAYLSQKQKYDNQFCISPSNYGGTKYIVFGQNDYATTNSKELSSVFLRLYESTSVFLAGFNVKVYGGSL